MAQESEPPVTPEASGEPAAAATAAVPAAEETLGVKPAANPEASATGQGGATSCEGMKTKELRQFLADRGHTCRGCAERNDFLKLCADHKHETPLPQSAAEEPLGADAKPEAAVGDIPSLVQLLRSSSSAYGKEKAAADLWNLAATADKQALIAAAGGIPPSRRPCA